MEFTQTYTHPISYINKHTNRKWKCLRDFFKRNTKKEKEYKTIWFCSIYIIRYTGISFHGCLILSYLHQLTTPSKGWQIKVTANDEVYHWRKTLLRPAMHSFPMVTFYYLAEPPAHYIFRHMNIGESLPWLLTNHKERDWNQCTRATCYKKQGSSWPHVFLILEDWWEASRGVPFRSSPGNKERIVRKGNWYHISHSPW